MTVKPTSYIVPYGVVYQPTYTAAAAITTGFILDRLSVAAAAAYSLRKLRADSPSSVIRVRRSSDNAEADIGFASTGDLDTFALLTHVGTENRFTWSESFDNAAWTKGSGNTITANITTDPFGGSGADRLNTISSIQNFTSALDAIVGSKTISIYAKAGTNRYLWAYGGSTNNNYGVLFDLQNGVVTTTNLQGSPTGTSNSITSAGNEWYRCSITATSTGVTAAPIIFLATGQGLAGYTGDGVSGVFAHGLQIEAGAFASSYIPTTTVSVPRNADVLTYPVSGNISNTTGSLYCEAYINAFEASGSALVGDTVLNRQFPVITSLGRLQTFDGTNAGTSSNTTTAVRTAFKAAVAWGTSIGAAVGGTVSNGSTTFDGNLDLTAIAIGNTATTSLQLFGTIRNVRIYSTQLSASQLQALTS